MAEGELPAATGGDIAVGVEQGIVERLAAALDCGAWDAEHGYLREREEFDGALRLVVSEAR